MKWILLSLSLLVAGSQSVRAVLPEGCEQIILGIADSWDATEAQLTGYVRVNGQWEMDLFPWDTRLGANGMAWGRGLHPVPEGARSKVEGDGRAPAGAFRLGDAYGYTASIEKQAPLQYHQVTESDLWVEDASSPHYNRHLKLEMPPQTEWEKKQQMRQNDPAHRLKLFIHHNAYPDIQPGSGSAIFFHVWRDDGKRATAGCTVMPYEQLAALIRWVHPDRKPVFVLLPRSVYRDVREAWDLP